MMKVKGVVFGMCVFISECVRKWVSEKRTTSGGKARDIWGKIGEGGKNRENENRGALRGETKELLERYQLCRCTSLRHHPS